MAAAPPVSFDLSKLAKTRLRIPAADFVGPQYDIEHGVETTDVILLLSTPRSGSTFLCELLRLNEACLAHEYFQPAQYMPLLAERWGCLRGNLLDEAAYVESLSRFRTSRNGWLGINLHGSHLRYYARMERHLTEVRFHYVHLIRRQVIPQAISYHLASQTRQWSSEFKPETVPEYGYAGIQEKLQRIQSQNALIQAFLLARGAECLTLYYEDLVARTEETLRRLPCIPGEGALGTKPMLRRQSDVRSADWIRRFAEDFLADDSAPQAHPKRRILSRVRRLLRAR